MAYNLLGYFTLIFGFMGLFSLSVPRWLGLCAMAMGGLSMFMSFSRSRLRAVEPLLHAVVLLAVAITAMAFHARAWFPAIGFGLAIIQLVAAGWALSWASRREHGMALPPFLSQWRSR